MIPDTAYFDWNGQPIEAQIFDAREVEHDLSAWQPPHPDGIVGDGEIHVCCRFTNGDGAFWATIENLTYHAEPLDTNAEELYREFGPVCSECGGPLHVQRKVGGESRTLCKECGAPQG